MRIFIYIFLLFSVKMLAASQSFYMYYMPLSVDTYIPVTEKDIQKRSQFYCELNNDVIINFDGSSSQLSEFDDKNIRAYIHLQDKKYWIDHSGLIKHKNRVKLLSDSEFKALTNNCWSIKK